MENWKHIYFEILLLVNSKIVECFDIFKENIFNSKIVYFILKNAKKYKLSKYRCYFQGIEWDWNPLTFD